MLLEVLIEKLARHLYGKNVIFKLNWLNRFEPCLESLVSYIVFYFQKTVIPRYIMVPMHQLKNWIVLSFKIQKKGNKFAKKILNKKPSKPLDFY